MTKSSAFDFLYNKLWLYKPQSITPLKSEISGLGNNTNEILTVQHLGTTVAPPNKATPIVDWNILTTQINTCTLCYLHNGRNNVVIERGNRQAQWMFIGEGPEMEDDLQGIPFVGNSGKLLDKMINAMKIDITNVYICNIVKCRTPENRNPKPEEMNSCKHYLLNQIDLVKPKIIICLGRLALQTLCNIPHPISKSRQITYYLNQIPVIVTYNPAYILRNPLSKKDVWQDLQLAIKVFESN